MTYQVERTSPECLTLRHTISSGWSQRYLLISDVHYDSPYCDRKLLTKHLNQAKDSGAGIICFGDWFDVMQGKSDKRGGKGDTRPEYMGDNYFDLVVEASADYLSGYRDNIVMLCNGNHETAILRHQETDLLARLCKQLDCQHGGYAGWIRLLTTRPKGGGSGRKIYYHHGSGGGGPVTKGVTASNRRAASVEADIYVSGHIHEAWVVENVVRSLLESGRELEKTQYHVQLPTYKREPNTNGYHVEKGRPAKPLGGYWLVLEYEEGAQGRVVHRIERAN